MIDASSQMNKKQPILNYPWREKHREIINLATYCLHSFSYSSAPEAYERTSSRRFA